MDHLLQDVRFAVRSLRGRRAFAFVAVLTLALGIGANTAIFSVVHALLLRSPFKDPGRLVVLWETSAKGDVPLIEVSLPDFFRWQQESRSFSHMAAFGSSNWELVLRGGEESYRLQHSAVSASFFETLGVEPSYGRRFRPEDDAPTAERVAVLSHGLWARRFGADPDVVGRSISFSGEPFTIVGVMPRDFEFPRGAELWTPAGPAMAEVYRKSSKPPESIGVFYVICRLKPRVTVDVARAEMDAVVGRLERLRGRAEEQRGISMTPLFDFVLGATTRRALMALWGAAGFVLLICCANVGNLLLARAAERQKEIAVRLALGAGRRQIVRQILTEVGLLVVLGSGGGILLALFGLKGLAALHPPDVPRIDEVGINGPVLLVTLGVSALATFMVGMVPASRAFRFKLVPSLKETASPGRKRGLLLNQLVVCEIALALILLVGAGLMLKSFLALSRLSLGYQPENVLTFKVHLDNDRYPTIQQKRAFCQMLLERVQRLPGVQAAGAVFLRPFELGAIGSDNALIVEGQPIEEETFHKNPGVNWEAVTPDYFRAMGIRLRAGRFFTDRDTERAPSVVIVGQSLARRFWPGENAVGKRLITWGGRWEAEGKPIWQTVVGVVEDARYRELERVRFDLYLPYLQSPAPVNHVVVRTDRAPLALVAALREEVKGLDKDVPIDGVTTMEQIVSRVTSPWRFNALLSGIFGVVALGLAAVGIYGLVAWSVVQRTREMGVRMALGARPEDAVHLILRKGATLAFVGLVLGLAASFGLTRLLASALFQVEPTDPVTFSSIALLLLAVAFLASYLPARRAARVHPAVVLRGE